MTAVNEIPRPRIANWQGDRPGIPAVACCALAKGALGSRNGKGHTQCVHGALCYEKIRPSLRGRSMRKAPFIGQPFGLRARLVNIEYIIDIISSGAMPVIFRLWDLHRRFNRSQLKSNNP